MERDDDRTCIAMAFWKEINLFFFWFIFFLCLWLDIFLYIQYIYRGYSIYLLMPCRFRHINKMGMYKLYSATKIPRLSLLYFQIVNTRLISYPLEKMKIRDSTYEYKAKGGHGRSLFDVSSPSCPKHELTSIRPVSFQDQSSF
jgi:hypothetical protein